MRLYDLLVEAGAKLRVIATEDGAQTEVAREKLECLRSER